MQSGRFTDLYITETQEHLQLLTRSVLALERGEGEAVEEAFRAAHTIKGLAAAMGHALAAEEAHSLEDRLGRVRDGAAVNPELTDELLAGVDRLEAAIQAGLNDGPTRAVSTVTEQDSGARSLGSPPPGVTPPGAVGRLAITVSRESALPEARAELIRNAAVACGGVTGSWPGTGEPFGGVLYVFLGQAADAAVVEAAVRRAGEVAEVRYEAATQGAPASRVSRKAERVTPGSTSVRVDRARLDEMAEGIAELSVLHARAAQSGDQIASRRASAVLASLQRSILDLRMVAVSTALDRVARLVRDAARAAHKEVDFEVVGGEIELDQAVLDALVDPLVHLLRNAVDHGIERPDDREAAGKPRRGQIRIEVVRERNNVRLLVVDDGRGVDTEAVATRGRELGLLEPDADITEGDDVLRLLFHPGFSTALSVTELSGRGVGLDVVGGRIRGLGGSIGLSTRRGEGTTFTVRVPISLALAHSLRVGIGEEEYALPITHVKEVVPLDGPNADAGSRGAVIVRDDRVSLVDLGRVLGAGHAAPSAAVVAELGGRRVALAVDRVIGHEQIVVRPFDAPVGTLPVFSGATILADGRPALLIDPLSVL